MQVRSSIGVIKAFRLSLSLSFPLKFEMGFHRWIGRGNLYFHVGYQEPYIFENFNILVFDGGSNDNGGKTTIEVEIPPELLPIQSVEIGGVYISIGLSFGGHKKNLDSKNIIRGQH